MSKMGNGHRINRGLGFSIPLAVVSSKNRTPYTTASSDGGALPRSSTTIPHKISIPNPPAPLNHHRCLPSLAVPAVGRGFGGGLSWWLLFSVSILWNAEALVF